MAKASQDRMPADVEPTGAKLERPQLASGGKPHSDAALCPSQLLTDQQALELLKVDQRKSTKTQYQ